MLTLLTFYPLNTHFVWLRLTTLPHADMPSIQLADYLHISTSQCRLSGIVLRQHSDPWRIDVLCYREQGDCLTPTFKTLLPEHIQVPIKKETWPVPRLIKPTILLANDRDGLAAVGMLHAWGDVLPSSLLLWQTQGILPFNLGPSKIYTPLLPPDMIATMLEFEDLGVVLRILSEHEKPGCFHGDITELLKLYPDLNRLQMLSISSIKEQKK